MIPDIVVTTYTEFKQKWANRQLFTDDGSGRKIGRVDLFENTNLTIARGVNIKVDMFLTPKYNGWKDIKQRRDFYADAAKVGVQANQDTKCEWYKKIIE